MVVHGLQVIHHCPLILTLFAAAGAEGQAASLSQDLHEMDALEAHDHWQFHGGDDPKKCMSFREVLATRLAVLRFFWSPQVSCT